MKILSFIFTVLSTFSFFVSFGQWSPKDFEKLNPLVGSWKAQTETGYIREKWIKKNDTLFTGEAYMINQSASTHDEQTWIAYSQTEITYIAKVSRQNKGLPVIFKLISIKDGCYTFENKEHDFPQQIIYCLKDDKYIDAFVSGTMDKGNRSLVFHFIKE